MTDDKSNHETTVIRLMPIIQHNNNLTLIIGQVLYLLEKESKKNRQKNPFQPKLSWRCYVNNYACNDRFVKRHLRMSIKSFDKLLSLIRADIVSNNVRGESHGGIIIPEIQLFCCLRWLAGGSYLDVLCLTRISQASFYRISYNVIEAINQCPQLQIKFPSTENECKVLSCGFENHSYDGAINNCIGAIDGYLIKIHTPTKESVGNVRSYFSGHYQCYGINMQGICDSYCRFIYVAVAAPGSSSDRQAVKDTNLLDKLKLIPDRYVLIGDAAYEPSEKIVPMYYGSQSETSRPWTTLIILHRN